MIYILGTLDVYEHECLEDGGKGTAFLALVDNSIEIQAVLRLNRDESIIVRVEGRYKALHDNLVLDMVYAWLTLYMTSLHSIFALLF